MGYGQALKRIRQAKGLSLWQVAQQLGCWPSSLWRIENEQRKLKADMLFQLCQIYGIKPEQLLEEAKNPTPDERVG